MLKRFRSVRKALNPNIRQGKRRIERIKKIIETDHIKSRRYRFSKKIAQIFGVDLDQEISKKINATAIEIGTGHGNVIAYLKLHCSKNIGKTISMDLQSSLSEDARKHIDEEILGDVLKEPIPKADFIFSNWTLGYVGHPDYMTRKIAEALKPNGIALLHFNSKLTESNTKISFFLDTKLFAILKQTMF